MWNTNIFMQPKNNSPGGIPGMPGIIGGIIPPIGIMLQEANRQIRNYLRFITTTVHLCVIYRPDQEMLSWLKNLQSGLILKGIIQLQSELLPWWHSWRHAVHHGRNTRHHWRHSYKVKRHVLQTYQPFSIVLYQTGNTTQEKSLLRNCAFKGCKSPYFYNMTNLCELTPHAFPYLSLSIWITNNWSLKNHSLAGMLYSHQQEESTV